MPHEHGVAVEIYRMELREASSDVKPVEDHHREAVLEVELATHRKARRREERVADDEIGDELARHGVGLTFVVVCEAIEVALGDKLL